MFSPLSKSIFSYFQMLIHAAEGKFCVLMVQFVLMDQMMGHTLVSARQDLLGLDVIYQVCLKGLLVHTILWGGRG